MSSRVSSANSVISSGSNLKTSSPGMGKSPGSSSSFPSSSTGRFSLNLTLTSCKPLLVIRSRSMLARLWCACGSTGPGSGIGSPFASCAPSSHGGAGSGIGHSFSRGPNSNFPGGFLSDPGLAMMNWCEMR